MSTATRITDPEPAHHYLVRRTVEACRMAQEAAGAAAEGIAALQRGELRVQALQHLHAERTVKGQRG